MKALPAEGAPLVQMDAPRYLLAVLVPVPVPGRALPLAREVLVRLALGVAMAKHGDTCDPVNPGLSGLRSFTRGL